MEQQFEQDQSFEVELDELAPLPMSITLTWGLLIGSMAVAGFDWLTGDIEHIGFLTVVGLCVLCFVIPMALKRRHSWARHLYLLIAAGGTLMLLGGSIGNEMSTLAKAWTLVAVPCALVASLSLFRKGARHWFEGEDRHNEDAVDPDVG